MRGGAPDVYNAGDWSRMLHGKTPRQQARTIMRSLFGYSDDVLPVQTALQDEQQLENAILAIKRIVAEDPY